jgi:hypothetical protein
MEHGKYVGVRKESRRDGVCTLKGQTLYFSLGFYRVYTLLYYLY